MILALLILSVYISMIPMCSIFAYFVPFEFVFARFKV